MHPVKDIQTGNSHDYTDEVVSAIDAIIDKLAKAKEEAMKDCPFEAEYLLSQSKIELRKVMQTVDTIGDFYERTVVKEGIR